MRGTEISGQVLSGQRHEWSVCARLNYGLRFVQR
jgi:hypothetical protein